MDTERLDLITFHFELTKDDDTEEISMPVFFPKIVDRFFFHLASTMYSPILQTVERGTYISKKSFTLKTLLMPLIFRTDYEIYLEDMRTNEKFNIMCFVLFLFKKKVNVLLYMFAKYGCFETIHNYLGIGDDCIDIIEDNKDDLDEYPEDEWVSFRIQILKRNRIAVGGEQEVAWERSE